MRPFVVLWGILLTGVLGYAAWVSILWLSNKAGEIRQAKKWRKNPASQTPRPRF